MVGWPEWEKVKRRKNIYILPATLVTGRSNCYLIRVAVPKKKSVRVETEDETENG